MVDDGLKISMVVTRGEIIVGYCRELIVEFYERHVSNSLPLHIFIFCDWGTAQPY
jgi:hypothetical protein